MENYFYDRTNKHIKLVNKWFDKIEEFTKKGYSIKDHDSSKFLEPEKTPYIYINYNYKCKADGIKYSLPEGMDKKANEATLHHITTNNHHPEYWDKKFDSSMFNKENRDEIPEKMVDATRMPVSALEEMLADWFAMSEKKGTDPKKWAKKNINKRWKFTDKQKKFIYSLIENVWEED